MIKAYIYKILHSVTFYLSIIGVFLICSIRRLGGALGGEDVLMETNILLDLDAFRKVIAVFATLPFAANFAVEWKSSVTNSCILRSSSSKYILSNIFFCFITAFITVLIGMILFICLYTLKLPLYIYDPNPKIPPYGVLIDQGFPMIYLLIRIIVFSFSCAMWSVSGLALTALFPDPFVAACSPFIASYLLERISMQFPDVFNLWFLSLSRITIYDNAIISFVYTISVFTLLAAFFGLIFAKVVKRRIANEFM